jgi:hypothetical protein
MNLITSIPLIIFAYGIYYSFKNKESKVEIYVENIEDHFKIINQ